MRRRELLNLRADDNKRIRQFMIAKLRPIRRLVSNICCSWNVNEALNSTKDHFLETQCRCPWQSTLRYPHPFYLVMDHSLIILYPILIEGKRTKWEIKFFAADKNSINLYAKNRISNLLPILVGDILTWYQWKLSSFYFW